MGNKSPEEVPLPPVGLTSIVVLVDKEFTALFPDKQHHGEAKTRNTQNEEIERSSSKNAIDSWDVEQENKQDGFHQDTSEHVLIKP